MGPTYPICRAGFNLYGVYSSFNKISIALFSFLGLSTLKAIRNSLSLSLNQNVTSLFETSNLISLLPTALYILQTALLPIYSKAF